MKQIKLTQGKYAIVDDEDFDKLNQFIWSASKQRNTWYATRHSSSVNGNRKTIYMHVEIMGYKGIDHTDCNGLNNKRNNLRACTVSQNAMNKKANKNCASKYKGVTFEKSRKTWRSKIIINGKLIHIGTFKDEISAAISYNEYAIKYHKEFARLNVIPL